MKFIFRYLGVFVFGALIYGPGYAKAETLQDAVQHMLQTNPEIRAIGYNRLARDQEITQARSGYLPVIDVSYGAGIEDQSHPLDDTTHPNSTI